MTYIQRVINDRPVNLFALQEGSLAFADSMGLTMPVVNGTPVSAPPLVVGGGNSYVFTGTDNFRFLSPVFYQDSPSKPFTLEAWFKPVNVTGPKGIVGHGGLTDGLTFDGEKISFITLHGAAGAAEASHFPSATSGAFHAVGVHTGSKNELYINGVRVAAVDLTEDQVNSTYQLGTSPGSLYVGHLSGSIIIDSVAVYAKAITSRQAKLHFLWGRDVPDLRDVISLRGGTFWTFTDTSSSVALDFRFDTDEEWSTGVTTDVNMINNMLLPTFDENGVTRAGSWIAGFILGAIGDQLDGSKIEWDSDGDVTVETSLNNGASWSPATNGREIRGISANFFSAEQALQVRVSFKAGESENTISRMSSLSIKIYSDRDSQASLSGQPAELRGSVALASNLHQPLHYEDKFGVDLYSGYAIIPAADARTLEFWINLSSAPGQDRAIFDARPGTNAYLRFANSQWSVPTGVTIYLNGEKTTAASLAIVPNRWNHLVVTVPVINGPVTIGTDVDLRLGVYANYSTVLSDSEVKELYNAYIGVSQGKVRENSGLSFVDSGASGIKIYTYAWTLAASG